jgi:hypothetical protein
MAQNVTVAGTGHGPERHGAGSKTPKVHFSASLLGGEGKTMGGWLLETGAAISDGNTTKAAPTTRRAWA